MPEILVIGASGRIARALRRRDANLVVVGRPEADLEDANSLLVLCSTLRPRLVINTAAYTAVDAAETEVASAFDINSAGARAVAHAAASVDAPVLHMSTDYVFDGTKGAPYVEGDTPNPVNVYGASKLAGENAVRDANPRSVVVRTAWVYSPFGKSFVSMMLERAVKFPRLEVVEDLRGSPSSADEIAEGLLAVASGILDERIRPSGIFHMAGEGGTSRYELAQTIFRSSRALGGPVAEVAPVNSDKYRSPAPRPADVTLDCSKLHEAVGFRMRPWREGVDACVRDIAKRGWRFA